MRAPLRRRRAAGLAAAVIATTLTLVAACSGGEGGSGGTSGPSGSGESSKGGLFGRDETPTGKELPMGGRTLFPDYRVVGFAGIQGTGPVLGKLGVGALDDRMQEVVEIGKPYAAGVNKVLPVAEFIATVVHGTPGKDGMYRGRATDEAVQKHLDAVRKVNGYLLLAIQPGRSDFVTETKYYEKFLKEPDVGVALDPEWRMGPGEIPMRVFGHVTGKELNDTAAYLSKLVKDNDLPEKIMLYHQLNLSVVRQAEDLKYHEGLAQMVSVDGIGSPEMKVTTWNAVMRVKPKHVYPGFKLFYMEDAEFGPIMEPQAMLDLVPEPFYVLYE
ncbi:MAG: hypothetical protein Q4G51_03425 [Dermatophilus congolensis]|nr:hypothetical protein [Dermatophilus congolensis]